MRSLKPFKSNHSVKAALHDLRYYAYAIEEAAQASEDIDRDLVLLCQDYATVLNNIYHNVDLYKDVSDIVKGVIIE